MRLAFGEVILIRIEFHQSPGTGGKIRPAVVLLDAGDDDVVVAPITSRVRANDFEFPIEQWSSAGLNTPSFVRVHKLTVLPKASIAHCLGALAPADRAGLIALLQRSFSV